MKFSIKDLFSKCDQIRSHFLCSVNKVPLYLKKTKNLPFRKKTQINFYM